MATTPTTRTGRGRVELLAALTVLLGLLFAGAAWAVLSDRGADIEQTRDRVATIEANQTPAFPAGVLAATSTPGGPPTATPRITSGSVPLLEPLTPTVEASTPAPGVTPTRAPRTPAVQVTPTAIPDMPPATHITVPAVGIDTEVIQVTSYPVETQGVTVLQWNVADWAAGQHDTSADPGEGGNIVMAGHDDYRGEVFRGLHDAQIGDDVYVTSPAGTFHYTIREIHLRKELGVPLSERLNTGVFMAPMPEERLTLITCWPYGIDDHRMIIVAKPAAVDADSGAP